jgi:hypothetical protein
VGEKYQAVAMKTRSQKIHLQQYSWKKDASRILYFGLGMVVQTHNSSYYGSRGRKIKVPRQKHKILSEKQTKSKRTGGMTQMGKCFRRL